MKKMFLSAFLMMLLLSNSKAQQVVPVYQEPRHKQVLLNKYVRVIDALIENGDTSLFHIHAAPSAFVIMNDVSYSNQEMGQPFSTVTFKKGHAWFSSYADGPVTHRVVAPKNVEIHAFDVEILGNFKGEFSSWKLMSADTIYNNEKSAGYRITLTAENPVVQFESRGPIVAILVEGEEIQIKQPDSRVDIGLEEGDYGYIRPTSAFSIRLKSGDAAKLVLIEVK
ncbi:MAG: hypothetical protein RLZZ595_44 [Bacteroidota bacterium]|jgi:hypothetical protein